MAEATDELADTKPRTGLTPTFSDRNIKVIEDDAADVYNHFRKDFETNNEEAIKQTLKMFACSQIHKYVRGMKTIIISKDETNEGEI